MSILNIILILSLALNVYIAAIHFFSEYLQNHIPSFAGINKANNDTINLIEDWQKTKSYGKSDELNYSNHGYNSSIQNELGHEEQNSINQTNFVAFQLSQPLILPYELSGAGHEFLLSFKNYFDTLGFYKTVQKKYFNSYPDGRSKYKQSMYGLIKDPQYCEKVDYYNLRNPSNIFKNMNFFTDYGGDEFLIREKVIKKIGTDTMPYIKTFMRKDLYRQKIFRLNKTINMYFTKRIDLHIYNELGKNFGCATQMYNHIPGHGVLKRKDLIVNAAQVYQQKYKHNPQCFNKSMLFPYSYRLYNKKECKAFFKEINSAAFYKKSKENPIQYIIKVGYGAHRASGVFLLDDNQIKKLSESYGNNGKKCGKVRRSLIAQKYIANPLLLDRNNKFDFRLYMLIASTNPLILYYHDGFLRVSLKEYDHFSSDRTVHLTNTHLAKKIFKDAKSKTIGGMNETELRNYQMWTMEDLSEYLYSSGYINDPNWLENYLRPAFQKAFIHIVRMTEPSFLKQSNVFEMYGIDFMLDSNLNLWFIECNSSPQLIGTNEYKAAFMRKMLIDMFEIQYSYFRSRMKRALVIIQELNKRLLNDKNSDISDLKLKFESDFKNKLEPEYNISQNNSFILIMDKNLKGKEAYFGLLHESCVDVQSTFVKKFF